ncbi:GNAT family N-acetyltransferase [Pontibacter chinhatensis]|uniref:Predicted N-acetyltransferase YhbS n=1 Tax=Pontibacter chinhatensis TaxID=1436961 RepID=A0A1I2Y270_9BACT|nr:GNAT family N-acetyltransferase [Pontibacter chinhatensis]SFH19056.1 Predicted N-acetyltransferase YhbS [Pontibacter chinhatensis]
MIITEKYSQLAPEVKSILSRLVEEEFGHVAFVQERVWAQPDWVLIQYDNEEIATFCHIVVREVSMDGTTYTVAGLNNVITPKTHRGKGYASEVVREAGKFALQELKCSYGLLLCADALLPFYNRLGWYSVEGGELYYSQPSGEQRYDSNSMLLPLTGQPNFHPIHINLNGLPW